MNANKRSSAFWNFDEMFLFDMRSLARVSESLLFDILRPSQVKMLYVIQRNENLNLFCGLKIS